MRTFSVAFATLLVALGAVVAVQAGAPAAQAPAAAAEPVGDPAAGKVHFTFGNTSCSNCHGRDGEGAFGPALAGRKLTYQRFLNYVRKPIGRMPAYVESELTDQEVADMVAYFNSLPPAAKPAPLRTPLPANPPRGQMLAIQQVGCGQCHGETLDTPRHGAAEVSGDFEWFKHMVYEHSTAQREQWALLKLPAGMRPVTPQPSGPNNRNRIRMGNYSRTQLPEARLKEIWDWVVTLGEHLPPLAGNVTAAPGTGGLTYTINVYNAGVKDKGVTVEEVRVALTVPDGAKVAATTGTGYKGIERDEELKSNVAVWMVPKMAPHDQQTLSITLAGAAEGGPMPKGNIKWAKPVVTADGEVNLQTGRGRG